MFEFLGNVVVLAKSKSIIHIEVDVEAKKYGVLEVALLKSELLV